MEEIIVDPAASYTLGGICLVLLAAFGKVLLYYRADNKDLTSAILKNSVAGIKALGDNAVANEKLSASLDRMGQSFERLEQELIRRPRSLEGDEV